MTMDVAVVGATSAAGEAMLTLLASRKFPFGELYALARGRRSRQNPRRRRPGNDGRQCRAIRIQPCRIGFVRRG